jgi:membrane protein implicated in regulation of membrane protease activity
LWSLAGLLLCFLELLHPGVFLFWIGLGACTTGGVTFLLGGALEMQLISFILFTSLWLVVPFIRRKYRAAAEETINRTDGGLIGQLCLAKGFQAGTGWVEIRDGSWQA